MYVRVSKATLYYEKKGQGPPLVLVHGNGESHEIFQEMMGLLSRYFTVYALDSRCHGKSSRTRELSYDSMAQDIVEVIENLGLETPGFFGFSDGGILGLLLASRYPGLLSWMVVSGANASPAGLKPFWHMLFRISYLWDRDPKTAMMLREPHISRGQLENVEIPVLVTAGSRDLIRRKETEFIARSLPQGQLMILKGENHGSYIVHSELAARIILEFARTKIFR